MDPSHLHEQIRFWRDPAFNHLELLRAIYITHSFALHIHEGYVAILPYLSRVGGNQLLSSASLLIVVGVMLDTVRQLEAQMVMRNYSGFLA